MRKKNREGYFEKILHWGFTFLNKFSKIRVHLINLNWCKRKDNIMQNVNNDDEIRTKQIGVLIPRKTFINLKKLAAIDGISFSKKAYLIIQNYVEDHINDIQAYDDLLESINQKNKG